MARTATSADIERVTDTIALAFAADPVWGVALARPDGSVTHHAPYWRAFVEGAVPQGSVSMEDDASAVAVWIPPGGAELTTDEERDLRALVRTALPDAGACALFELWDRFESNHPEADGFAYLSLLATHPDHRGKGIGQRLLAEDLARWDAAGIATYLESTNPANDHRYERAGFRPIGRFESVVDGAPITMMWRSIGSHRGSVLTGHC